MSMSSPFVVRRRVRFGDCDPGGVIYTPRLSYFVVEAVLDFLSQRLGGPAERRLLDMGIYPPARALAIEFLSPLEWDDEVEIHVRVAELRTHAMSFSVVGYVASSAPAFTSQLTRVCISPETRRPVPIPALLREALSGDTGP
jgi:4-hydroxybenzoyl-CoA thioesterase